METLAIIEDQVTELGLADAHGVCQHSLEHRFQLTGRTADDAEDLGARGLLLQRSESSRVRACTSSNSRTFSIAITAWSAKVSTSSICFWVKACASLRTTVSTPTNF